MVAGAADAREQLVDEPLSAALGVRLPLAVADVQHLTRVRTGGDDRVIAVGAGVSVTGALLLVTVDLADEAVHVDHQRTVAGAGARFPRARERDVENAGGRARS